MDKDLEQIVQRLSKKYESVKSRGADARRNPDFAVEYAHLVRSRVPISKENAYAAVVEYAHAGSQVPAIVNPANVTAYAERKLKGEITDVVASTADLAHMAAFAYVALHLALDENRNEEERADLAEKGISAAYLMGLEGNKGIAKKIASHFKRKTHFSDRIFSICAKYRILE